MDLNRLSKELELDSKSLKKNLNKGIRQFSQHVLTGVAKSTPVDTGRAKYNWQVKMNSPAAASLFSSNYGKRGGALASLSRGFPVINTFNVERDKSLHITNNLIYIEKLNEGYSKQAPSDFVGLAIRGAFAKINFKDVLSR